MPFDPTPRSSRAQVRNPLLAVPGLAEEVATWSPETLACIERAARLCSAHWRVKGDECWKKHKPPMAAYWKAWAVNARHMALLCAAFAKSLVQGKSGEP